MESPILILLSLFLGLMITSCFSELNSIKDEPENEFPGQSAVLSRRKRAMRKGWLWEKGIVPYSLKEIEKISLKHSVVGRAVMNAYQRLSCIKYVEYTGPETNQYYNLTHSGWVKFIKGSGCYASVGNTKDQNGQSLSCCTSTSLCEHEMGHALGFLHEQSSPSPERLKVITVHKQNLQSGALSNWQPYSASFASFLEYDVSSVMHYEAWMDSQSGKTSFSQMLDVTVPASTLYYFLKEIAVFYGCQDQCKDSGLNCEYDGYLTKIDGKCACQCVPGLSSESQCTQINKNPDGGKWPKGPWAILQTKGGCATGLSSKNRLDQNVEELYRLDSTEDLPPKNVSNYTGRVTYCVKNSSDSNTDYIWPAGTYCIYKHGEQCPDDFYRATVLNITDPSAEIVQYCCKIQQVDSFPIVLPNKNRFSLLKYPGHSCPQVVGMQCSNKCFLNVDYDRKYTSCNRFPSIKKEYSLKTDNITGSTQIEVQFSLPLGQYCDYRPAFTNCGDVVDLSSSNRKVEISSPSNTYADCVWLFRAPEGDNVVVNFEKVDSVTECSSDLEIRKGRPGQKGKKICGSFKQESHLSIYNYFYIRFKRNGNQNDRFAATVKLVPASRLCYNSGDSGESYGKKIQFTENYAQCLPWHQVPKCEYSVFNTKIRNELLNQNYCRNPDRNTGLRPWCYISASSCQRQYCDVCENRVAYDKNDDCESYSDSDCRNNIDIQRLCAKRCSRVIYRYLSFSSTKCPSLELETDEAIIIEGAKDVYNIGDTVVYKCKSGNGEKSILCRSNGKWTLLGSVCSGCEDGFSYIPELKNCYHLIKRAIPFPLSKRFCDRLDSKPASSKSLKEAKILKTFFGVKKIWLDVNDRETEHIYVDGDGNRIAFDKWGSSQPDDTTGSHNCVVMTTSGKWDDRPCEEEHKYICVKPLTDGNCVEGWSKEDSSKICYWYSEESLDYVSAYTDCVSRGATTATDFNKIEHKIFTDLGSTAWVGLTKNDGEGWTWSNGQALELYKDFTVGYPSSRCAMLQYNTVMTMPCRIPVHVVCQKSVGGKTCLDSHEECSSILAANPTMCDDYPQFALLRCPKTCSKC